MENSILINQSLNNDFAVVFRLLKGRVKEHPIVPLEAEGKSMHPLIENGSEVRVRLTHHDELKIGDIIAFKGEKRLVIHRYLKKNISKDLSYKFLTKGDNVLWFDDQVVPENILGKVVSIKRYGRSINLNNNFWKINNFIILRLSYLEAIMRKAIFYRGRKTKPKQDPFLQPLIDRFLSIPFLIYLRAVLFLATVLTPRTKV